MKKKIAIIGASTGQYPLVRKAKEKGLHTICFAWPKGAVCKDICDEFYPISIFEIDEIVAKCKELGIVGVATTASEETSYVAAQIASLCRLNGTSPEVIKKIQNKGEVRCLTKNVEGLSVPKVWSRADKDSISFPCVVKPVKGSAKKGVSFCKDVSDLQDAFEYASASGSDIIAEEFIAGKEYSVESLSWHGRHKVVQITRKVSTGEPHFVELEHHQPAELDEEMRKKVEEVVARILTAVGYTDGASHTEIKIQNDHIYLIEINPRGGGDRISDTLIGLSTDCDYLSDILDIALDSYTPKEIHNTGYSGIMYLTSQNPRILKYLGDEIYDWEVEKQLYHTELSESKSNYDRDGYIIYKSDNPIQL